MVFDEDFSTCINCTSAFFIASLFQLISPSGPFEIGGTSGGDTCGTVPLNTSGINVTIQPNPQTPIRLQFLPEVAAKLHSAFSQMNASGITPMFSSGGGFRTAADQAHMRAGGSGTNPAAQLSYLKLGLQ
jgi:hypothetical protein